MTEQEIRLKEQETTLTPLERKLLDNKLPTKLPQGVTEFTEWANDILDTYGLPNNDSTHFALATAIMHAKNGEAYFSKEYFAHILMRGAANQVAHHIMLECKARQEAKAAQEAEAAKQVEDTTSNDGSSDVKQLN